MCGIFMIVSKNNPEFTDRIREALRWLAVLNVDRGDHSWGVWGTGIPVIKNNNSAITDAASIYAATNLWKDGRLHFIAGHTRHATHGGRTAENAHPFQYGNMTLAHNGVVTVPGYSSAHHPVDSGQLLMSIVDKGWVDGLKDVSGSCGLVMSVDVGSTVVPLVYKHSQMLSMYEGDFGWLISSEPGHAECAMAMSGLVGTRVEIPEDIVFGPWSRINMEAPAKKYSYSKADDWRKGYTHGCGGYGGSYGFDDGYGVRSVWNANTQMYEPISGVGRSTGITTTAEDIRPLFPQDSEADESLAGEVIDALESDEAGDLGRFDREYETCYECQNACFPWEFMTYVVFKKDGKRPIEEDHIVCHDCDRSFQAEMEYIGREVVADMDDPEVIANYYGLELHPYWRLFAADEAERCKAKGLLTKEQLSEYMVCCGLTVNDSGFVMPIVMPDDLTPPEDTGTIKCPVITGSTTEKTGTEATNKE